MKKINVLKYLLLLIVGFFVTNCNNNDSIVETTQLTDDEILAVAELDDVSDELNNIVEEVFEEGEVSSKESDIASKVEEVIPCLTKTIVLNENSREITLDFGEGCELPSGNVVKGKIILSHVVNPEALQLTITQTFDGFYFNDILIDGENSIERMRANENGNPQSTVKYGTTFTWVDGTYVSREGSRTREWIEGYDTRNIGDNIFLITGDKVSILRDGTIISSTIIEPLQREMACRFIVSGKIEIDKFDRVGVLDFGNGSCDNSALFTNSEGEEIEIQLRNH